ncbi:MAG TPA: chromate resistance protein ChrB domain-containing protein [Longimicrobium sp.]|nr:chromate resistance protein ChrB domain-containing protein [Longimicrobium sp.]
MNDTTESSAQASRTWLLFVPHLPPKPDYLRVKLRRRLQRVGAVLLKSSVYALPRSDETMEDLQWLRREIIDDGGEAMVCEARLVSGLTDAEIEAVFRGDRDARYAEIAAEARARRAAGGEMEALHARLQRRLAEVVAIDFFEAPGRAEAEHALQALRAALENEPGEAAPAARIGVSPGSTWVTRRGVKVDRICSAWLIRRFIDPHASFRFVPPDAPPAAGELRFDMFEGEFTHEGDRCTFETLLARAGLEDPGLRALAEIVHDIDCKDGRYGRAETAGIAAVVDAVVAAHPGDEERIAAAIPLLDGLHRVLGGAA